MLNVVIIEGRLVKAPELRKANSGINYCSFTIANNKYSNGEKKANFFDCKVFNKNAENLVKYCGKGSLISVIGSLEKRQYTKQDGTNGTITEVIVSTVNFLSTEKTQTDNSNNFNNSFNDTFDSFNQPNNFSQQNFEMRNTGIRNNDNLFNNYTSSIEDAINSVVNPFKED